jgi:hypothetical protein
VKHLPVLGMVAAMLSSFAAPGHAKSPVTVYFKFEQPVAEASIDQMKLELAAIVAPIGLEFEWRPLNAARGREVAAELVVVTFKGACRMEAPLPAPSRSRALGWTHITDGVVLPFADISCDGIRTFIDRRLRRANRAERDAALGRAIGRVLAHELYHIFNNTVCHGGGIAKPFYSAAELVAREFRFEEKETRSLRNGRLAPLIRDSDATPRGGGRQALAAR